MENFDPERYANDNYDEETLSEINKGISESNGISISVNLEINEAENMETCKSGILRN